MGLFHLQEISHLLFKSEDRQSMLKAILKGIQIIMGADEAAIVL